MAVVRSESEDSWKFLLNNLRDQLEVNDTLVVNPTIMSDRAKALINAVKEVFPEASHGYCLQHLYQNYFNRFKGQISETAQDFSVKATFYTIANAQLKRLLRKCRNSALVGSPLSGDKIWLQQLKSS